jgi:hypothetical protein
VTVVRSMLSGRLKVVCARTRSLNLSRIEERHGMAVVIVAYVADPCVIEPGPVVRTWRSRLSIRDVSKLELRSLETYSRGIPRATLVRDLYYDEFHDTTAARKDAL